LLTVVLLATPPELTICEPALTIVARAVPAMYCLPALLAITVPLATPPLETI